MTDGSLYIFQSRAEWNLTAMYYVPSPNFWNDQYAACIRFEIGTVHI